ncbi:DUF2399 domain-containing protein [Streptomyces sp. NPDC006173]|uniref:DUF2399 domain-containing protein n=1 Tax=Streptomyces sp. NPDC006173 TaxID=3155349 RepID=UPI0033DB39D1
MTSTRRCRCCGGDPSPTWQFVQRVSPRCPMVCATTWPNSAAIHLFRLFADQGASLRYHGDFDGEGIRIAAYLLDKTPARPWRMTAADYRAAAASTPHGPDPGRLTEAPWHPELTRAMAERRIAVVEELLAEALLVDLIEAAG